jgi:alkylation response protein AidB-like acyl-CoA dehydrogenase
MSDAIITAELLQWLSRSAGEFDSADVWPGDQLHRLAEAGVLGWVIPREFGGSDVPEATLMQGYQKLAEACLTTTFVLTQMNAAARRIANCGNDFLKALYLPGFVEGKVFATVGISHLSTSRQHWAQPSVRVTDTGDGNYIIDGDVPWVTGAGHADVIVTGGSLPDGKQVLLAVPTSLHGVTIGPPARLLALSGSQTASAVLNEVRVDRRQLIAGPVERVMQTSQGGTGSLATSALALGLAARAVGALGDEAGRRPELSTVVESFRIELERCRLKFTTALNEESTTPVVSPEIVREGANSLVLRVTQAWLAVSKGSGFVHGHPAEQAVREAMFFLVWSCPKPVVEANLRELSCLEP